MRAAGCSSFPLTDLFSSYNLAPVATRKKSFANGSATAIAVNNETEVVQSSGTNVGNLAEHEENINSMRPQIVC